jgi:transposase
MNKAMPPKSVRSRTPRVFTPEFRQGAVRLVLEEQRSMRFVAENLGIGHSTLAKWVKTARTSATNGGTRASVSENAEIARLKRALREAEMERDILKKATAFFAKQST